MYLNNYLNNYIKHIKFYSNYFKYLTYFKQLFKIFCLIFIDINFYLDYILNNEKKSCLIFILKELKNGNSKKRN